MAQTLTTRVFICGGGLFSKHVIKIPLIVDIIPIGSHVGIWKFNSCRAGFLIPVQIGGLFEWGIEIH